MDHLEQKLEKAIKMCTIAVDSGKEYIKNQRYQFFCQTFAIISLILYRFPYIVLSLHPFGTYNLTSTKINRLIMRWEKSSIVSKK